VMWLYEAHPKLLQPSLEMSMRCPPPPHSPPVLTGHVSSLAPYKMDTSSLEMSMRCGAAPPPRGAGAGAGGRGGGLTRAALEGHFAVPPLRSHGKS